MNVTKSFALQEGESSKRVQTLVVLVLSFRSSSSSSCSVRRWRLLSITEKKQRVTIMMERIPVLAHMAEINSLSSRQQVLFLILLDSRTAWLHLQRRCGGLLCSRLDEMSKQLCLLQQVLKSVGPICLLLTREEDTMLASQARQVSKSDRLSKLEKRFSYHFLLIARSRFFSF